MERASYTWCVAMLGGPHKEITLWRTLGDVLEGSGWTMALTEA